jgi:acetyl esterase/lipase
VIAAGESAGGFLAAASAMVEGHDNPDDDKSISGRPNALYLIKPVMDISDGRGKRFRGASRTAGAISPVLNVASNTVPTYIIQGTLDGFLPSTQLFKTRYDEIVAKNNGKEPFPLRFDIIEGMSHTSRTNAFYNALQTNAMALFMKTGILDATSR